MSSLYMVMYYTQVCKANAKQLLSCACSSTTHMNLPPLSQTYADFAQMEYCTLCNNAD